MRSRILVDLSVCVLLVSTSLSVRANDVKKLIDDLESQDKKARIQAIDELGRLGAEAKSAVPALIKCLTDKDNDVCWHAERTLGAIGPAAKASVPTLLKDLAHQDSTVRAYAAFALGQIGKESDAVIDGLLKTAFDKDVLVRRASFKALRKIDAPQEKTLPIVVKMLEEGDASIVMPALHTYAELGKEVVPRLCGALKHDKACYWACIVLAEIGPDAEAAVPHLKSVLKHKEPEVRLQALVTLGEIGKASKSLIPDMVEALDKDEFGGVRYAAAYALGKAGLNENAAKSLSLAAKSKDPFLRLISAWALARNNPKNKEMVARAVDLIVESFKSDNAYLRSAAARAVAEFDVPADVVAPPLMLALKDADASVVGNAIEALAALGPKVLDHVEDRLKNKDLRHYSVRLIYRMGPEAKSAVPALIEAISEKPKTEEDIEFRREVQFALAAIGPAAKDAVPTLIESLSAETDEIRSSANYALGKIGPAAIDAVPAIRKNLTSENPVVKISSAWALLRIRPGNRPIAQLAAPLLIKALDSDRELARAECATALGELGDLGKPAIPRLKELLNDESPHVRESAATALKKLEG